MNQRNTIHAYSLNDSQTGLLASLLDDYLDKLQHNEIQPDLFEFADDTAGEIAGTLNLKSLLQGN